MSRKVNRITFAMSRHRKAGIITLCLFIVAVFVWFDNRSLKRRWRQSKSAGGQARACDIEKYHKKTFTVVKIVDGDTLDINVPDVNHNYTRIRLLGVDSPETRSQYSSVMYFGPEAAEFAEKSALVKQATIYLEEHNTRGKYGRLLAYVQLPDGRFLNEVLLAEGFAYSDLRFRHSLYQKYKQLESSARRQQKGLWEEVTREQLPEWLQRMEPELLSRN